MTAPSITLVPADPALAGEVLDYYRRNRDFLAPFEPQRPASFFTLEEQQRLLAVEKAAREQKTACRFYIRPPGEDEKIIGAIGLNTIVWGGFLSCFLGYKLDAAYIGRGYMTEAVALVTAYAFEELGLHRIEANVMPRNKASLRVLEKNGYVSEGLSKEYLKINGVWEDHIHMVKLNHSL